MCHLPQSLMSLPVIFRIALNTLYSQLCMVCKNVECIQREIPINIFIVFPMNYGGVWCHNNWKTCANRWERINSFRFPYSSHSGQLLVGLCLTLTQPSADRNNSTNSNHLDWPLNDQNIHILWRYESLFVFAEIDLYVLCTGYEIDRNNTNGWWM